MSVLFFLFKLLGDLNQEFSDGEALRADLLALAAADAVTCLALVFGMYAVIIIGVPVLPDLFVVHTREKIRYRDLLGTALGAVAASRAGDKSFAAEDCADLVDGLALTLVEGLKVLHVAEVVVHHIHIAHARKNHLYSVEACGKSDRVACIAATLECIEHCLCIIGEIDEATALYGLHDYDGLAVLLADLEAEARLYCGIVVVEVIELYLNDLEFGIFGEDLIENVGGIVEGKSYVLDLALCLKLKCGLIRAASLVFFVRAAVLRVHKIEVKIVDAAYFELLFKEGSYFLIRVEIVDRELIGEDIAISGIAGGEAFFKRDLTCSAEIAVRGVEIVKSVFNKRVYHTGKLGVIDLIAVHGKAHTAESKILFYVSKRHIFVLFSELINFIIHL